MTNRRRPNRAQGRAQKRGNLWLPFFLEITVVAGASNTANALLDRYLTEHGAEIPVGTTLGPIRGRLSIQSVTDTDVDFAAFCAMYLTPEGGLGAVPSLDQEQLDAMWYGFYPGRTILATGGSALASVFEIQTKAMRKITEIGEQLTFQVDEVAGETNLILQVGGHIFMKLP